VHEPGAVHRLDHGADALPANRRASPRKPSASAGIANPAMDSPSSDSRQTSSLRRLRSNPACNTKTGLLVLVPRSHAGACHQGGPLSSPSTASELNTSAATPSFALTATQWIWSCVMMAATLISREAAKPWPVATHSGYGRIDRPPVVGESPTGLGGAVVDVFSVWLIGQATKLLLAPVTDAARDEFASKVGGSIGGAAAGVVTTWIGRVTSVHRPTPGRWSRRWCGPG
jgi:hypothetical protein